MTFSFSIGEKVVLKKDRDIVEILLLIGDSKAKIRDENGFEYYISLNEILPLDIKTHNSKSYGNTFNIKKEDLNLNKKKNLNSGKSDNGSRVKIDLHIEKINSYFHHMQNSEIVQIQMDYCRKELDLAMVKGRQSIEIIHGIGEGILMNEVHKLLDMYNLRYYVSNDLGSTEVIL